MEGPQPEAAQTRPRPLAAFALVVAIPAAFALLLWQRAFIDGWVHGVESLVLVTGGTAVMMAFVGRNTLGPARTLGLAVGTCLACVFSGLVLVVVGLATCGEGRTIHPLTGYVFAAAGVVYVASAYWAVRKGWWWAPPVAVILAIGFGFLLAQALPGVPNDSTGRCFN
jgi:hypothetical protein